MRYQENQSFINCINSSILYTLYFNDNDLLIAIEEKKSARLKENGNLKIEGINKQIFNPNEPQKRGIHTSVRNSAAIKKKQVKFTS